jgi:hypothetical protein
MVPGGESIQKRIKKLVLTPKETPEGPVPSKSLGDVALLRPRDVLVESPIHRLSRSCWRFCCIEPHRERRPLRGGLSHEIDGSIEARDLIPHSHQFSDNDDSVFLESGHCSGLPVTMSSLIILSVRNHCNLAYSAFACFKRGMSGSPSARSVKKL